MKIKPSIYAKTLLESEKNDKNIARNFWYALQKNKQYRELHKILDSLDSEFANNNQAIFVKIFAGIKPSEDEINKISEKLQKKYKKNIIIRFVKKDIVGLVAQIEDTIIDLTVENKIKRLKKVIGSDL